MTVVPLIARELLAQARRKGIYWLRFAVGLAAVLICLPQLLFTQATNQVGKGLFDVLTVSGFILCCFSCLLTSESIGAELREGTLGLLVLTRVRLIDIIAGKLAANALPAFMVLAVLLPLLMVPLLTGGVTFGEASRKALVLLETLFLSLTVGLYSSVSMRERFPAVRRSAGWLLFVVGVPAIMNLLLPHSSVTIGLISPIWTMILAGDSKYTASPKDFWISLVLIQAIGLVFLFRACFALRRGLVEESEPVPAIPPILRRHIWHGIGVSAAYWVASRQRGFKTIVRMAVLLWVIFNLGYGMFMGRWYSTFGQVGLWLPGFLLTLCSSVLLAWGASRALIESRQTGELELLLTTPMGVRELLKGHWLFHKRALRFPLGLLALTMALPWVFGLLNNPSAFNYLLRYVAAYPLSVLSAILGFAALCQVGLWFGLTAPTQARAIFATVLAVKGVPMATSLLGSILPVFGFTGRILPIYLLPNLIAIAYYIWIIQKTWQRISRF